MSGWLKFLLLLVLLAVGSIMAVNAATYNKIASQDETVGDVTPGGARFLMWINIIFSVIVFVAALWWFYVEYFATSEQIEKINAAKQAAFDYYAKSKEFMVADKFSSARNVYNTPRPMNRMMPGMGGIEMSSM